MVKVKLIENPKYFKLMFRCELIMLIRRIMLFILLIAFPVVFVRISLGIPLLKAGLILTIASQLIGSFWLINYSRRLKSLAGSKCIEMDGDCLIIKSSDQHVVERNSLNNAATITLSKSFSIYNYSYFTALKGVQENFISIHQAQQVHTYFIDFESHYMIEQLNKLILQWTLSGIKVDRE